MLHPDECKRRIYEHERVACCISGGKDSMAVAMHLRPFWDRITFYWSNPGDPLPETFELMRKFAELVPNYVEVTSNVILDREEHGMPSDVVPENMITFHTLITGEVPEFYVQHRVHCCINNFYAPLHNRLIADHVTLVIRGEKQTDHYRNYQIYDGYVDPNEVHYMLPLWDTTTEQVLEYMKMYPEFLHPVYEFEDAGGIDCMGCTAWIQEISMPYLEKYHPEVAKVRREKINIIEKNSIALLQFLC